MNSACKIITFAPEDMQMIVINEMIENILFNLKRKIRDFWNDVLLIVSRHAFKTHNRR